MKEKMKDIFEVLSKEHMIDGNRQQHNKIKHTRDRSIDTYSLTFKNVLMMEKTVDIHPLKTGISVHFLSR